VVTRSTPEHNHGTSWSIISYYTKKLQRQTDALGEIIQSPDTIAEPLNWTGDAKLQLAMQGRARHAGCVFRAEHI